MTLQVGMGGVVIVVAAIAMSCASVRDINPTKEHPVPACRISCPGGFFIQRQVLCKGGKRWFTDVLLVGEYAQRGADGMLLVDDWIANDGQLYPKDTVQLGACSTVIAGIIQSRQISERGQHVGEDSQGRPQH